MAVAARTRSAPAPETGSGRLASPAMIALVRQRSARLGGLALGVLGLTLLLALLSYDPRDPSFDTATTQHATNIAGPVGAALADLLLQGFGLAGVLPGLAMLAWAWRIASYRGIGSLALRLMATLTALPVLAAVFAVLPLPHEAAWPTVAGLGGAIGSLLAGVMMAVGRGALGPAGAVLVWIIGLTLAGTLVLLALGLSAGEWRAAGRTAMGAARVSVSGGRVASGRVSRVFGGLAAPFRMLGRFLPGRRSDRPSRAERPAYADRPVYHEDGYLDGRAPLREPEAPMGSEEQDDERAAPAPAAPRLGTVRAALRPKAKRPAQVAQESLPLDEPRWRFPSLNLLKPAPARSASGPTEEAREANARLLESVLSDYGVQGTIGTSHPGPVVTLYELVPAPGIRSARVIGLADDVARSLSVTAVRIATVPGRNVIGIEVPNARRETVFLSEIFASEAWRGYQGRLPLALGKDIGGEAVITDLSRMPHLMIAGTTGSGKSVGINAMILSLLYRMPPEQCRLILIDPKMLELSVYEGIPHLMAPVVTEPAKAVTALKWTVREMERRYRSMSQLGVRNIGGYNERVADARAKGEVISRRVQTGFDPDTGRPTFEEQPLALEPLPFIVVVVDEMADLMMVAGKEIEAAVQRLAQMARAAGIHVIMATQRPSVDVITGTIKANFPTRISFQVISKFDSRTILGEQGAEQLLGQGDMLFMQGGGRIGRVHGPFVSDDEVEEVVKYLRSQGEPAYLDEVTEPDGDDANANTPALSASLGSEGERGLYEQAIAVVAREGKASTSFIQRHLNIGYNRAAKLIEQMEKDGVVGPANHVGRRDVLIRHSADED
jgi:S-DNA-T family DNA segregation ATPase FtsK/SpoIIIE